MIRTNLFAIASSTESSDGRDFRRQMSSASCLVLVLAAIIYWQIREIQRAIAEAREDELQGLRLDLLSRVSPIGW